VFDRLANPTERSPPQPPPSTITRIARRPLSDREKLERTPQVVTTNEALREVTLFQVAGAKQTSRTFRFDKVLAVVGCVWGSGG